jgi:hypothetical protein
MTAVIFCIFLVVGYAHFVTLGPILYGERTIYTVAYWATTLSAVFFALKTKERSNIRAACCIFAYAWFAPLVYKSDYTIVREHAILWAAVLDVAMAYYFIFHGGKRWEITVGLCFLVAVAVSMFTAGGLIPDHMNRPYMFIAFAQPDLTALCGHAANVVVGFGSADTGRRIYNHMAVRRVAGDFSRGVGFMFGSKMEA